LATAVALGGWSKKSKVPSLGVLGSVILLFTLLWILGASRGETLLDIPMGPLQPKWTLLLAALALHGFHATLRGSGGSLLRLLAQISVILGTASSLLWVFWEVSAPWRTVMLAVVALVHALEAVWLRERRLYGLGLIVALLGALLAGLAHREPFRSLETLRALPLEGTIWGIPAPLLWTLIPMAVLYVFWGIPKLVQGRPSWAGGVACTAAWLLLLSLLDLMSASSMLSVAAALLAIFLVRLAARYAMEPWFLLHGLATALLAGAHLFLANLQLDENVIQGLSFRMLTVLPVLGTLFYVRSDLSGLPLQLRSLGRFDFTGPAWDATASLAITIVAALIHFEVAPELVAALWAAAGFAALTLGHAARDRSLAISGHLLLLFAGIRGITVNPSLMGSLLGIPIRFLASVPVALLLLAASELSRWQNGRATPRLFAMIFKLSRAVYPWIFTFFVAAYIFHRVEGPWRTFAWSLQGGLILALGFSFTSRHLRLAALTLLALCIGKAFLYDVRGIDPIYRVLSFIILGLVLIGVSLIYTRFRQKIMEYL
ncbi:MAG: DUF2339 domain-containing protein, partial [Planctomycetota bacterium]